MPLPYLNTDNQKMYGGANFKQGLPRTVGLGQFSSNIIQRKAGYCKCIPDNTNTNCNYLLYYTSIFPAPIPNKPFIAFTIGGSSLETDINSVISDVLGSILFTGLSSFGSDCSSNYSFFPLGPLSVIVQLTITQAGTGNITVVTGFGFKNTLFPLFAGGYAIVSLAPVSQVGTGIYNTTDPITISVAPYP